MGLGNVAHLFKLPPRIESVQMEMNNGSKNTGTTLVTCSKDKSIHLHYWELDK